jgi:hypothetical protein
VISVGAAERAFGAAILVGIAFAAGWAAFSRYAGSGARWFIVLTAVLVAVAATLAAGGRGRRVQMAAVVGVAAFLLLGEHLQYRHALPRRLIAMHAAEGATDAVNVADDEMRGMDRWKYLAIEIDLAFFASAIGAFAAAWWIPRRRDAVVVMRTPARGSTAAPTTVGPAPAEGDAIAVAGSPPA